MIEALRKEIAWRKDYIGKEPVETIYFGGGTPSLLTGEEIAHLLKDCHTFFDVVKDAEITLEANPDDINIQQLSAWKQVGINRLSIGIQSFFDEDLEWMNRAHNSLQAKDSLTLALRYFPNVTIDLIYGTPLLTDEKWKVNVDMATSMGVPHISCYALTVEERTPLSKMIRERRSPDVDPDKQSEQFLLLMKWLADAGYEHYEISNFAKPGSRSRHNSSYWATEPGKGVRYLGIGPSAHSYNGHERQWNISNNAVYIRSMEEGNLSIEKEQLTRTQELNEYIMTSLRTINGINLKLFDESSAAKLLKDAETFLRSGKLQMKEDSIVLTNEGKLLADGIAAALFF